MAATKYQNILNVLENYLNELKEYSDILKHFANSKTILGHEVKERDKMRESLVRKTGMLKSRIIELTGKQYYEQFMRKYDIWDEAFNPSYYLPSSRTALNFCINATNEAIGKLEIDIEQGIRDAKGNLVVATRSIDAGKASKTYENRGGRTVGNEFELALQGTVDMLIECIGTFIEKINYQGYRYKNTPIIGGHPDWAEPDRTCSATCTITEIIEGTEKQIGTIKLQLLPKERALLKTSSPKDWDSSFKYFMDVLLTEFEQLGYTDKPLDASKATGGIINIIGLTETKLRKTIRVKPQTEREIQDKFEDLLMATDIKYLRDQERIVYSSKTYQPDFSFPDINTVLEIKLCN